MIMVGCDPETSPERWTRYQGGTPTLTDVRGDDQIPLAGPMSEDYRQDLRRKFIDGHERVLDRPGYPQNHREIPFHVRDL